MAINKATDQPKSHSNKSTRSKQDEDNDKKRKAEDSASDEEKSKSIKKANVAFDNSMDMDLHIYTVRESSPYPSEIDLQVALLSNAMPSNPTAENLFSMDLVPYKTPHRGWCHCFECYYRHKEEQHLYESNYTSDYTLVIEPVYDGPGDTLDTLNDSTASLNPPFPRHFPCRQHCSARR